MGIYPDMSLDDAKKSLASEKMAYRNVAGQEPEFVIRDGRIQSADPSSSQLPVLVGAAVSLIVVGTIAWLFLRSDSDPAPETTAASAKLQMDKAVQRRVDTLRSPFKQDTESSNTESITPNTDDMVQSEEQTQERAVFDVADEAPVETPNGIPETTVVQQAQIQTASINTRPIDTETTTLAAQTADTIATASISAPEAVQTPDNAQVDAPRLGQTTLPIGTRIPDSETPEGLLLDSRVARGNLTSGISQREPVDDLGSYILGNGAGEQQYFFFTELRELTGQRVRHRWLYNNRVVAEVPFYVGRAWRWRVYSSKTFIPSMSGSWHAQVVLDDDTVIYSLPFSFNP